MILNMDGIELLQDIHKNERQFVYLDPPYYAKGGDLYLNHYMPSDYMPSDHHRLADFLNQHNDFPWVLIYDNLPEVRALYGRRRSYDFSLNYHTGLPKIGKELLVVSDKVTMTF